MAFQAGGPHALDRALEALAYAYAEMTRHPAHGRVGEAAGKGDPLRMTKTFHVVPRGVALVIGCNTFPTWNSYPGLFASLVTGNPVSSSRTRARCCRWPSPCSSPARCSPRPASTRTWSCWPPRRPARSSPATLALHPRVRIVDFTGSTEYGDWLEANARQAAGLHREGRRQHGRRRLDRRLRRHVPQPRLLADPLQRPDVHHPAEHPDPRRRHRDRPGPQELRRGGRRDRRGGRQAHRRPGARRRADRRHRQRRGAGTAARRPRSASRAGLAGRGAPGVPRRRGAYADDREAGRGRRGDYGREWFGPISFAIATDSTAQSLELLRRTVGERARSRRRSTPPTRRCWTPPRRWPSTSGCTCPATSPVGFS